MLIEWINANYTTFLVTIIVISIWDIFWKATAAWKASKRGSKMWFVVLIVLNTAGILPIIYLLCIKKKKVKQDQKPVDTSK